MSFEIVATLTGDRRLLRQLRRLGSTGAKRAMRSGINKSTRIIVKGVKSEFPPEAKSLKRVVGVKVKVNNKEGVIAKVGMNVSKKRAAQLPHGHLYVLGTKDRRTKSGAFRGRAPAHNVVDTGYAKVQSQAKSALIQGIRDGIIREANRP